MHRQSFNQLPPLRQSLSSSSLRSDDPGPTTIEPDSSSSRVVSYVNGSGSSTVHQSSPHTHDQYRQPRQYPPLTLPLPGPIAAVGAKQSSTSQSQYRNSEASSASQQHPPTSYYAASSREESSPQASRASSSRSHHSDMMYSNYPQQYSGHQLPSNAQYGGALPQQQAGRMLPSAHAGMLPPVYPQSTYAASSLPGPSPYDNSSAQQILTPSSTTHTLMSTSSTAALGADASFQGTRGNYRYELRVEQQPQRARMCGFGDKDRRPITPPPCVRLVVKSIDTGQEVDVDRLDGAFFVLQVDLWDQDGNRDVNIIRASSSAPSQSISTAVQMGYPPPASPMYVDNLGYNMNQFAMPNYVMPQTVPHQNQHMVFTRNLIGSLTVNASQLKDTEGNAGFWFVLSDLSVRTEGWFRLRMTFIDVGTPSANGGDSELNRHRCPVLSSIFSDRFQVYSAKKFPGVIESTPLSKCFAHQGIKIPIRKDGKGDKNDDDDG